MKKVITQDLIISHSKELFDGVIKTLSAKGKDYATNNDPFKNMRMSDQILGISIEQSIMARMLEKLTRVSNLMQKESSSVTNESISDTVEDLIGYAALLHTKLVYDNPMTTVAYPAVEFTKKSLTYKDVEENTGEIN